MIAEFIDIIIYYKITFIIYFIEMLPNIIIYKIILNKLKPCFFDFVFTFIMAIVAIIITYILRFYGIPQPHHILIFTLFIIFRYLKISSLANCLTSAALTLITNIYTNRFTAIIMAFVLQKDLPTIRYLFRRDKNIRLLYVVILYTIALIFAFTLFFLKRYLAKKYSPRLSDAEKTYIPVLSAGFIFISVGFYILSSFTDHYISTHRLFILTMSMFLAALSIAAIIAVKAKATRLTLKQRNIYIKEQAAYIQTIEELQSNLKIYKHDYHNLTLGALHYISQGDIEGVKKYYQNEILPFEVSAIKNDTHTDDIANITDSALKGVIWSKSLNAQEKKIKFKFEIEPAVHFDIRSGDLCRIVGIWLDNAIEAIKENDMVNVAIFAKINKAHLVISNPVKGEKDLMQLLTPKHNGRGLGLKNVAEIIERCDNVDNNVVLNNGKFVQTLIVENK